MLQFGFAPTKAAYYDSYIRQDFTALLPAFCNSNMTWHDMMTKVEAVRAEREVLRQERAALEDKLADVEKFQSSERGRALDRMEQDLAKEKMARVELEADRDDLQSQLAAALQVTART